MFALWWLHFLAHFLGLEMEPRKNGFCIFSAKQNILSAQKKSNLGTKIRITVQTWNRSVTRSPLRLGGRILNVNNCLVITDVTGRHAYANPNAVRRRS